MDVKRAVKAKRQKKKKSRTEVFSSDSESEVEKKAIRSSAQEKETQQQPVPSPAPAPSAASASTKEMHMPNDGSIAAAFSRYYMQRATGEFAEDLDLIRGAEDFKDEALPLLIGALQQGTSLFSIEDRRRVVLAGLEREGKGAGE